MTKMSMSSPLVTFRDPKADFIAAHEASMERLTRGIQEVRSMCLDLVDTTDWRSSMGVVMARMDEIDHEVTTIHQRFGSEPWFMANNRKMLNEVRTMLHSISGMLAAKESFQKGAE